MARLFNRTVHQPDRYVFVFQDQLTYYSQPGQGGFALTGVSGPKSPGQCEASCGRTRLEQNNCGVIYASV
jgi:hypothetical protein